MDGWVWGREGGLGDIGRWPRRLLNTGYLGALAAVERRIPYWPSERVERLQRRRLRAIVRHAYETVPFYRRVMDERGLRPDSFETVADLAKLPLLDDAAVRTAPEQFASTRYDDRSRRVFYSSGSLSHVRKEIYWDNASILRKLARAERDRVVLVKLAGQPGRRRQLHIYPPAGTVPAVMGIWDEQTWVSRRLVQRRALSSAAPFPAVAVEIDTFQPHAVFSHGSYAEQFFRFLADQDVAVAVPRVWRYGGDMLSPGGRELIESFGCVVYSTYQATETGRIGFQCERREGFHLNIDLCAVRIVDDSGEPVPTGEPGEVVISNLHNRATVLLNYRLGDRAVLAPAPCPCGRSLPLLERLEGRASDLITLADGRILPSLALEGLFRHELRPTLKVQIIHPAPGDVRWRVVPFAGVDREALGLGLRAKGRDVLGVGTRVEVEFVDDIPPTPAGKVQRVVASADARG